MGNDYFQFKEFKIEQASTAMKVGTDGVLLGAWANCTGAKKILDVGTGTGLIALMMAQRTKAMIDAIEIDLNAWFEAKKNIENSPWPERINHYNESYQQFQENPYAGNYDLIVTNPPYFSDSLKPEDESRSNARHNDLLPFHDIINGAIKQLNQNGILALILPIDGAEEFTGIAITKELHLIRRTLIKPTPEKEPSRMMMEFSKEEFYTIENTLIIEDKGRHQYSEEYIELTKDFYLNF